MGGGGRKNPLSYVADAIGFTTATTLGGGLGAAAATSSDAQGAVQNAIDSSGLNPETSVTKMENEGKKADAEQKKREADIEESKNQADLSKKNAAKRNRQRSLMGTSGGRSSTILTSGLAEPNLGGGKTLLGS